MELILVYFFNVSLLVVPRSRHTPLMVVAASLPSFVVIVVIAPIFISLFTGPLAFSLVFSWFCTH